MGAKPRILIVDDNVELCANIQDILEASEYTVESTGRGKDAISLCKKNRYDLCLMDIKLPDIPGPKVIEEIKEISPLTEFIYITGYASLESALEAVKQDNVAAYQTKPLNFDHLQSLINQILRRKRAEEEVYLKSEIVENMAEGVFIIRASDGIIMYTNSKLEQMFGYSPGELVGKHISIVNAPTDRSPEETANEIIKSLNEYGNWSGEVYNIGKDGTSFWCHANVSTFEHSQYGTVWVSVHEDISERKQAEEEKIKAQTFAAERKITHDILEGMMDSVALADLEGKITYINKAFTELFGFGEKEATGDAFTKFVGKKDVPRVVRGMNECMEKDYIRNLECNVITKDKKESPVLISTNLMKDLKGKPTNVLTVIRDITERKRAESALRDSEEQYRLITEMSSDSIYTLDKTGNITFMNEAGAKMYGYKREEIVGKNFAELVTEARLSEATKYLGKVLSGEKVQGELYVKHKKGYEFLIYFSMGAIKKDGEVVGFTGSSRDITERKRTEEKLRYLSKVFMDSMDPIIIEDLEGNVIEMNDAAEQEYGWKREKLMGKSIKAIVPPSQHKQAEDLLERCKRGGTVRNIEGYRRNKAGKRIPIILSLSLLTDEAEKPMGIVTIVKNIANLKQAQQQLEQNAQELALSNTELAAINRELESFSYSVSHDLRAPLRGIDGFSKIMLEDYSSVMDKKGQHYLQRMRAGVQNMSQLIDDLLILSHIGRKAVDVRKIDMEAIARKAYRLLKNEWKNRKVNFTVHPCPSILADENLMQIVFTNLLSNSLKFTRNQQTTEIEVSYEKKGKKRVFFVRDNGLGFDMKYAGKIFAPFQRLHAQAEYEGTGIGLATVQRIIHKHGGQIWAKSKAGSGTTFYFNV